jgi:hypothetical protein
MSIFAIKYFSRPDTQNMPGTANTGWFGTGTTTNTHRRNPSPPSSSSSGGTHTSTGKIFNLVFLSLKSLFSIGYGGTTRR